MDKKKQKSKKQVKSKKVTNPAKIKILNQEINSLNDELQILKEKNLRILAEFENFKKRSNQNLSDSYNRNIEKVIVSFPRVVTIDIYTTFIRME